MNRTLSRPRRPVARSLSLSVILTVSLLFLFGCAEGSVEGDGDAGTTTTPIADSGNANNSNNTSVPDMGTPVDMSQCGMCCPNDRVCLDDATIGVCNPQGTGFGSMPCPEGDECSDGTCTTPPLCNAGEKSCFDEVTVLTCRATEDGYTTMPCADGTVCFEGACTSGGPTGAPCTTDDECASNNCHCGSGTDETCPAVAVPGYCTKECTDDSDCGADAYCVDGDLAPLGAPNANYNHCAPTCEAICGDQQFGCIKVPHNTAEGDLLWDDACYFPGVAEIGQPCSSDDECIGECLETYINDGYCSRRCDGDGVCPDGSACVELRQGEFWCSLLCGDGSIVNNSGKCPRDVPVDDFSVTCKNLSGLEANRVFKVCASTSS